MAAPRAMTAAYGTLAVIGAVLPLAAFLPWVGVYGFDPTRFAVDLFANRVSSFFAIDVAIAAAALVLFVIVEGVRARVNGWWLAVAATLLIGVSCGLPLFLALRERARRAGR